MNTFTKVLLTVPFLFGTVACAGEDRIVSAPNPYGTGYGLYDIKVNCSQGTFFDTSDNTWTSPNQYPSSQRGMIRGFIEDACD